MGSILEICMNQTSLKRKSYFLYSESARTLFRVALQYSVHENDCVGCIPLKRSELGIYVPLKENKLVCFANREGSFRVQTLVHDFWKKYHEVHVSASWWCTHAPKVSRHTKKLCTTISNSSSPWTILVWTSILYRYEHLNSYTLKIMQLFWTVVTYLRKNVEHCTEHDIDSSYGVCIR